MDKETSGIGQLAVRRTLKIRKIQKHCFLLWDNIGIFSVDSLLYQINPLYYAYLFNQLKRKKTVGYH